MNFEVVAFIIYFLVVLAIGIIFFLRSRGQGEKDYFLGGRRMGPWVTALSAEASDMSAWLLMGLPGSILAFGFGQMWVGIGLAMGTAANWIFVAKRLRKFSHASGDSITLPQYLSRRFAATSPVLQVICAIIFLVCFTIYVASSFVAGTSVFTTVFPNLNERTAMIIFALIIICYTFFGGFKAVCWTDFFQGLLILAALLAVPIVVLATQNLDTSVLSNVYTYTDAASGEVVECSFGTGIFDASVQDILSGLAWGLGYFGMPHILVRFMSIEKPSMVKKSATVAIIWVILALAAACVIAYFGRMILAEQLLTVGAQKNVFVAFIRLLFPGILAGLLLAAIVAASMSTADSQLLVSSSSFTSDIYKPLIRKNASDKEVLWVGRFVVLIVAVIAFFIASSQGSGAQAIMDMVENAWGGFGSAFGPVVLLSVFWRRFTYRGAIAGVIAGGVVDVLWYIFLTDSTGIYELLPGFMAGLIAAVVVTLIDKTPHQEALDIYDKATAKDYDN